MSIHETNDTKHMVTLADTIEWMTSDDWRERLLAEYWQVVIRRKALAGMLDAYKAGTLEFQPNCLYEELYTQFVHMGDYQADLNYRLHLEHIGTEPPKKAIA